jgi:hypothetical protein
MTRTERSTHPAGRPGPSPAGARRPGPGTARGFTLAIAALLAAVPCAATAADPAEEGAARLLPFKQALKGALMAGLKEGPEAAVEACRLQAPAIADANATATSAVGRTSHRPRNPANEGPEWARRVLEAYLDAPTEAAPQVVALPDGHTGYVEPIRMGAVCTTCHGTNIDPALKALIEEHYPRDRATGFEEGELRGVFWTTWADGEAAEAAPAPTPDLTGG